MNPSLFPTPAAGFDEPSEILDGCHERIRRQCALIVRIAAHLAKHGADAEAREAAAGVIRYFEGAAANHHRDEEEDLFPLLHYAAPSGELNAVRALLALLRDDHRRLEARWADMHSRLAAIVEGRPPDLDADVAEGFAEAYERHIALEEAQLLPLARRVLDARATERMGTRMARRRGVAS